MDRKQTEFRGPDDDGYEYNLTLSDDGKAGVVNRVGEGRMTPEQTAEMAARLHEATGQPVLMLKHVFDADHSLPRRPRAKRHSYTKKLLTLDITESTTIQLRHARWCDAACGRWNCNCDPEIITSKPLESN